MHPGQRLREGSRMEFSAAIGHAREIVGRHFHGRRTVRLWTDDGSPVRDTIDAIGHVPLPPYIKRAGLDRAIAIGIRPSTRASAARSRRRRRACTSRRRSSRRCATRASSAPASRCMSATERSSRSASTASKSTRWKRSITKCQRRGSRSLSKAKQRRAPHHCGRHDHHAHAGIAHRRRPTAGHRRARARRRSSSIPVTTSASSPA